MNMLSEGCEYLTFLPYQSSLSGMLTLKLSSHFTLASDCCEDVFTRMMRQQITIAEQTLNDHWNDVCKAWINGPTDRSFVNRGEMRQDLLRW